MARNVYVSKKNDTIDFVDFIINIIKCYLMKTLFLDVNIYLILKTFKTNILSV